MFDEARLVCAASMGRSQATTAASCGLPKRDRFMLSSFARPYVPANDRPRKAAGPARDSRNSCTLPASVSMPTPHSSRSFGRLTHFCSTIEPIIDRAIIASQGRLSKNGAIIDQSVIHSKRSEGHRRKAPEGPIGPAAGVPLKRRFAARIRMSTARQMVVPANTNGNWHRPKEPAHSRTNGRDLAGPH